MTHFLENSVAKTIKGISTVGVKVHQSIVGLGTHAGPNHDKK